MPKRAKSYAKPHWHDTRSPLVRNRISRFEDHYIASADHDHALDYGKAVNKHFGHHKNANFREHEILHHDEWGDDRPSKAIIASQFKHSAKHWKNLPENTVLHRGVDGKEVAHMHEGNTYHMRPLLSTAANEHGRKVAQSFARNAPMWPGEKHLHMIEFHGVDGKHTFTGIHASQEHFGNEHEVVLAGNSTQWKLHKIEHTKEKVRKGWSNPKYKVKGEDGKWRDATNAERNAHAAESLELRKAKDKELIKHYNKLGSVASNSDKESANYFKQKSAIYAKHAKIMNAHNKTMKTVQRPSYVTHKVSKYLFHPAEKEAHLIPTLAKAAVTVAKKV